MMSTTTTTRKIRKDRATQLDEDFGFHGFIAKKQRKSSKTVVRASQQPAIPIGTVITYLNGKTLEDLTPTELTALFSTRSVLLRPTIPERETPNVLPMSSTNSKNLTGDSCTQTSDCILLLTGTFG